MRIVLKWLVRLTSIAVAIIVVAVAVAWWFASRSLPDYDADWAVRGVTGEVEIVRSNANVPHIFGTTDEDVVIGLGFPWLVKFFTFLGLS